MEPVSDVPTVRVVDAPSTVQIEESSHIWYEAESLRISSPPSETYLDEQRRGFVDAMSRVDAWLSVAVGERDVVGLVGGLSPTSERPDAYLAYIAVALPHRGRGIGNMLLRHAATRAHALPAERMLLTVHRTNTGARQLYERAGWRPTGRHQTTPTDELLLEYVLDLTA